MFERKSWQSALHSEPEYSGVRPESHTPPHTPSSNGAYVRPMSIGTRTKMSHHAALLSPRRGSTVQSFDGSFDWRKLLRRATEVEVVHVCPFPDEVRGLAMNTPWADPFKWRREKTYSIFFSVDRTSPSYYSLPDPPPGPRSFKPTQTSEVRLRRPSPHRAGAKRACGRIVIS